jgi:hypothetical protein
MAQKHKSKYKAPKDLEKSQKPKPRKDLKDYTEDDKDGKLNPMSTGDKQLNVLRKTDKEMVDTGDMYVKYNADEQLYKDLEDGEWDPKHAAKVLKKRQDTDEKDNKKNIKDKIENLTREQKERLVREYVRRKIYNVLLEQEDTATPEEPVDPTAAPAPEAPVDAAATPPTDVPAPDMAAPAPAPIAAAAPAPAAPAVDPTAPPVDAETQATPEELGNRKVQAAAEELAKEGAIGKMKLISKMLKQSMQELDIADQATVYKLLRQLAIKKLSTMQPENTEK